MLVEDLPSFYILAVSNSIGATSCPTSRPRTLRPKSAVKNSVKTSSGLLPQRHRMVDRVMFYPFREGGLGIARY
jgi:hypothetical protein